MTSRTEDDGGLEALARGVEQAKKTLPGLIQRRDALQAELGQINQKVGALAQYISAFSKPGSPPVTIPLPSGGHIQIGPMGTLHQVMPGPPAAVAPAAMPSGLPPAVLAALGFPPMPTPAVPPQVQPESPKTSSGRAPRGMVYTHVDAVLMGGGKFTLKGLRDEVKRRFALLYGSSSIHRAVTAGVQSKRYKVDGNEYSKA